MGSKVTCMGLGNTYTRPLGYVVIWVQVEGVQSYDEDQIALVILDSSNFVAWILVILETPTIGWVVNLMREAEVDALATLWADARAAHLLSVHRMMPVEVVVGWNEEFDTNGYDWLIYTLLLSHWTSEVREVLHGRMHVMVQALQTQDGSLPQGLTVQNTHTELRKGSKKQSWW